MCSPWFTPRGWFDELVVVWVAVLGRVELLLNRCLITFTQLSAFAHMSRAHTGHFIGLSLGLAAVFSALELACGVNDESVAFNARGPGFKSGIRTRQMV